MLDKLDELLGRKPSSRQSDFLGISLGQTRQKSGDPVETIASGALGKLLSGGDLEDVVDATIKIGKEQAQREIEAATRLFGRKPIEGILRDFRRDTSLRLAEIDGERRVIDANLAHLRAAKDVTEFRFRTRPFIVGEARLRAHEVIEQIDSPNRKLLGGIGRTTTSNKDFINLRRFIVDASKFDIRSLRAEDIPPNAEFSRELEDNGLLKLPYRKCWFEWDIEPGYTIGCMAFDNIEAGEISFSCLLRIQGAGWGNWEYVESEGRKERNENLIAHVDKVSRAAVVIISSRSAEKTEIQPSARVNRQRERGHVPPLFSHTVVEIRGVILGKHGEVTGRTHRSPRMHWRRGHLRHFRTPDGDIYRVTPIAPMLVGSEKLGRIEHDYVVAPRK